MREAPGTAYVGICIKPISGLSKLLQLVMRRTRLAMPVVLTTDRLFWLEGPFYCSAAKAAAHSSARKERLVFPLTVMMPRGPSILSLR